MAGLEHVDREMRGGGQRRGARRRLVQADQQQRRIERYRGEAVDRQAAGLPASSRQVTTVTPVAKQPSASRSVRGSCPLRYSPLVAWSAIGPAIALARANATEHLGAERRLRRITQQFSSRVPRVPLGVPVVLQPLNRCQAALTLLFPFAFGLADRLRHDRTGRDIRDANPLVLFQSLSCDSDFVLVFGSGLAPGSAAVAMVAGHSSIPAATISTHCFLSIVPPPNSGFDRRAPFTLNRRREE